MPQAALNAESHHHFNQFVNHSPSKLKSKNYLLMLECNQSWKPTYASTVMTDDDTIKIRAPQNTLKKKKKYNTMHSIEWFIEPLMQLNPHKSWAGAAV